MTKALVISSEAKLATTLKVLLTFSRLTVMVATNTIEARKYLSEVKFDIILFNIHHQDENAFSFMKDLRRDGVFVPVLYLGERAYEEALLLGSHGHAEYLLKPFQFGELKKKMNSLLSLRPQIGKRVHFRDITIDMAGQLLIAKDKFVSLGKMEMKILLLLVKKTGGIISGVTIRNLIEAEGIHLNKTVFHHIHDLSKKLETISGNELSINLTQGGYRLEISS